MGQGSTSNENFGQENTFFHFTAISMTYAELLPNLFRNGLVVVHLQKPLQPP